MRSPESTFLLGLLLCLPAGGTPQAGAGTTTARAVLNHLTPCGKVAGEEAYCGSLSVLENRATNYGRKIDLSVLTLPARSAHPAPDPLVYIAGGPGYGAIDAAKAVVPSLEGILRDRDVVFIDQRGTGRSNPLRCDLPGGDADLQGLMRGYFPIDALRSCQKRLSAVAELTQYTSQVAVVDLDDVRAWLGYERINLLGRSYGTRVAQAYMRSYPDHVRAVVLDGTMIADARMPLYHARKAQDALEKLFDDCGSEKSCRTAFPDLGNEFRQVLSRLGQGPAVQSIPAPGTGRPVRLSLSRRAFTTTLRSMQYSPQLSRRIPLYIHRASEGDFGPFIKMTIADRTDPDWNIGLYLSIVCSEDVARIGEGEIAAQVAGTYMGDDRIRDQQQVCNFWPTVRVPDGFFLPLESSVPTLLISGGLDPMTPPEWAANVANRLWASRRVVIRDQAHGSAGLSHPECFGKLISDFVSDGSALRLDDGCARAMKRPPFLVDDEPLP